MLSGRERLLYFTLVISRVVTNILDVLAIFGVGVFVASLTGESVGGIEIGEVFFRNLLNANLTTLLSVVALLFVCKSVVSVGLMWATSNFLANVEARVADSITSHLFGGTLTRLEKFSRGNLYVAVVNSASNATHGLLMSGASFVSEGSLLLFVLFGLSFIDPILTGLTALYLVTILGLFHFTIRRRLSAYGSAINEISVSLNDALGDLVSAFKEMSVKGTRGHYLARLANQRSKLAKSSAFLGFLQALPRIFMENALILGLVFLVTTEVVFGANFFDLATAAVLLAGGLRIMGALLPVQSALANIRVLSPQARLAHDLFSRHKENSEDSPTGLIARNRELSAPDVTLEDVWFSHPGSPKPTLKGVSLKLEPGSFSALIGPSGSGKSTVADLLLGLRKPDHGTITYGNLTLGEIWSANRQAIGYVPQNPGIIRGSLLENITLGDSKTDLEWLDKVLIDSDLFDWVKTLPAGLFTDLSAVSERLSGGQKQRVGIARALYQKPTILVLDEVTSSLDADSENLISRTILNLRGKVTILVIAHRLTTVKKADSVFVLDRGEIIGHGPFTRLRKELPLVERYADLMGIENQT